MNQEIERKPIALGATPDLLAGQLAHSRFASQTVLRSMLHNQDFDTPAQALRAQRISLRRAAAAFRPASV